MKLQMLRSLAKGKQKIFPHLQNQSANPEDWLLRDEEGVTGTARGEVALNPCVMCLFCISIHLLMLFTVI